MTESIVSNRRNSPNMQARRRRILAEARLLLIEGGVDGLSIRRLAEAADVAPRTIYSLIGYKEDVLIALYAELQSMLMTRITARNARAPLDIVEVVAFESAGLFRQDPDYSRAAFLAVQHLDEVTPRRGAVVDIFAGAAQLLSTGFQACIDAGLLRGHIPARELAELALQSYRTTWMQWACYQIDIDQSLADALRHVRIILMADATEDFRAVLLERLYKVE